MKGARLLMLSATVAVAPIVYAESCQRQIAPQLKALDMKIREVRRTEPKEPLGPQVNVGSCASRLDKLRGNFLCCKTFANIAPVWEEVSCLQLKKEYLQNACKCHAKGLSFSEDELLQDRALEAYSAVRRAENAALAKGIRNPVIRRMVAEAAKIRHCFSIQTIQSLNSIARTIERLAE